MLESNLKHLLEGLNESCFVVPELFHRKHAQVGLLLTDWLVFSNFLCTRIELCSATYSVSRQPFSALYARKVVAKGVPRFLNCVAKIESEMAISLCLCVKFSCANSCRYKLHTGY